MANKVDFEAIRSELVQLRELRLMGVVKAFKALTEAGVEPDHALELIEAAKTADVAKNLLADAASALSDLAHGE